MIDRAVRRYDAYLFANLEADGAIHIYRKAPFSVSLPHHVFTLTDTWTIHGKPVEWGIEPVLARLKAMDLWKEETEVDRIETNLKKQDETKERDFKNNVESFLKDFRRQFARSTDGINTGSLAKIDNRRPYGA